MPAAAEFSAPEGSPPLVQAFSPEQAELIGYVFRTRDWPPERVGYNAPIEALVGMDLTGRLTGVRVLDYYESHQETLGDFLRRPGFQEGFTGKHIGDAFSVRDDIDGIARATVSVRALARGVRDAARRVAATHLETAAPTLGPVQDPMTLPWYDLRRSGVVEPLVITDGGSGSVEVSLVYVSDDAFGERLVGSSALGMIRRALDARDGLGHPLVYGLDGPTLRLFTREGWSVAQGGDTIALAPGDVMSFGLAGGGIVEAQVVASGAMILDATLDLSRPFSILFDQGPGRPPFWTDYTTQIARRRLAEGSPAVVATQGSGDGMDTTTVERAATVTPEPVVLATPEPAAVVAPEVAAVETAAPEGAAETSAPEAAEVQATPATDPSAEAELTRQVDFSDEPTLFADLLAEADWQRVGVMVGLLLLATIAFVLKNTLVRGLTLAMTLIWLGYLDGGFLSVSHITSGIWAGPGAYAADLSLLLIVLFTVVSTVIFGRVFCGFLCPFGALQDLLTWLVPVRYQRHPRGKAHRRALLIKYGVLAVIIVPAVAGLRVSLYQYFEPFGTVFFWSSSVLLWSIAGGFLALSAVVPRFYCRYVCPLGAALAVGSLVSPKRIRRVAQCDYCKVCEQRCPTGAISGPRIDFKECVRCNVCEIQLNERNGVCRHDLEDFTPRLVQLGGRHATSAQT